MSAYIIQHKSSSNTHTRLYSHDEFQTLVLLSAVSFLTKPGIYRMISKLNLTLFLLDVCVNGGRKPELCACFYCRVFCDMQLAGLHFSLAALPQK
jgi:hypothetical protein